ncbi:hypothetical protein [Accumulibacter sp.]|uniref:hypothetical protein n=1 Tax=Accumulibacter sp. TaxID=2053492 RepID=UPI001A563ACB|nr:hypothetical protein [Accumulibacter sp.]MBL8374015.1 hypothetical protein [Accumulibacter sp.]
MVAAASTRRTRSNALLDYSVQAIIVATADERMALEGEDGHGVFTLALLEGLAGQADCGDGFVAARELADHVEKRVPDIALRKWRNELFPFGNFDGQTFPLVPRQ